MYHHRYDTSCSYSCIQDAASIHLMSSNATADVQTNKETSQELKQPSERDTIKERQQKTKAQKRRDLERLNGKGELKRGYNWVDIISHVCDDDVIRMIYSYQRLQTNESASFCCCCILSDVTYK